MIGNESETITGFDALVGYFAAGCKPPEAWRVGTEHEKFVFHAEDFSPVAYEGENGIRALLEDLRQFGWTPVMEEDRIIGLGGKHRDNISLEPGGQFELSGAPLRTLHETCAEINEHLDQMRRLGEQRGIGFLGHGFAPHWELDAVPRMPKERYIILESYMKALGFRGLEMMFRTCTVQANLDFSSEEDMVKKLRVSLALQPMVTAIFANSPFCEGQPNGYLSLRSHLWTDLDPARTGMLDIAFEPGFGFAEYVRYALDVPMHCVYRNGRYVDVCGRSFRDFLAGELPGFEGERPMMSDWSNHLATVFTEVRVKQFLEMRGADAGPWRHLCALPAFWVGLLYHQPSLDAAWEMTQEWSQEERNRMRAEVPTAALDTQLRGERLVEWAKRVLPLAQEGLRARGFLDSEGQDERIFLSPIEEILQSERAPAQDLLARFHDAWDGDATRIFSEYAY